MDLRGSGLHHLKMDTSLKRPSVGARVRLSGFLGVFEIVRIAQDGSFVDLKHLDNGGPDYIEQEMSSRDLIYLNPRL